MRPRVRLAAAMLVCGAVFGYAAGFSSLRDRARHRHATFEQHVADVCTAAAARTRSTP